jgi:hypothetical protein
MNKILVYRAANFKRVKANFLSTENKTFERYNFSFNRDGIELINEIVNFCASINAGGFTRVDLNSIKNFVTEILKISMSKIMKH